MSRKRQTTDRREQAMGLAKRGLSGFKNAVAGAGKRAGARVRRTRGKRGG